MSTDVADAMGGSHAIRRALDVTRVIAQLQRSGATLSRVTRATGLTTSTVHRILKTLTEERMLRYDATSRSYHVGLLAFELGLSASAEDLLLDRWRVALDEIARETQLTTYLVAQAGNESVCLHLVHSSRAVRAVPMVVGQRVPLGLGAGSLAILASLSRTEAQEIVTSHAARLDRYPGGRNEAERILERVEDSRKRGFAISAGSIARGVIGVGLAIEHTEHSPRLGVSVSAVADQINSKEARAIASTISKAIARHGLGRPSRLLGTSSTDGDEG
jgi:DNA-binding IclR family transcriptional regulator